MHPKESAHPIQKWTDRKHTSPIWIALDSPCHPHLTLTQNLTNWEGGTSSSLLYTIFLIYSASISCSSDSPCLSIPSPLCGRVVEVGRDVDRPWPALSPDDGRSPCGLERDAWTRLLRRAEPGLSFGTNIYPIYYEIFRSSVVNQSSFKEKLGWNDFQTKAGSYCMCCNVKKEYLKVFCLF